MNDDNTIDVTRNNLRTLIFEAGVNTFTALSERSDSAGPLNETYEDILYAMGDPAFPQTKRRLAFLAGNMLNSTLVGIITRRPPPGLDGSWDSGDFQKRAEEAMKALEAYLSFGIAVMCPPPPIGMFKTTGLADAERVLSAVWSCIHAETAATNHMSGDVRSATHAVLEGYALHGEHSERRAIFSWWLNAAMHAYDQERMDPYLPSNTYRVFHDGRMLDLVSDSPANAVRAYFKVTSELRRTTVAVRDKDGALSVLQVILRDEVQSVEQFVEKPTK